MSVDFNPTNRILLTIIDILREYGALVIAEHEDYLIDAKSDSSQEFDPGAGAEILSVEDKQV